MGLFKRTRQSRGSRQENMADGFRQAAAQRQVPYVSVTPNQGVDLAAALIEQTAQSMIAKGRIQDAIDLYTETADGDRRLLAAGGVAGVGAGEAARIGVKLARTLTRISMLYGQSSCPEPALSYASEAVEVSRGLAVADPAAFESDFAWTLIYLSVLLAGLGRLDEAVAATEEAVAVSRRQAAQGSPASEIDLVTGLSNLSALLAVTPARQAEAEAAAEEAARICRRRAAADPAAFQAALGGGLRDALDRLAEVLDRLGRAEQAAAVRRDSSAPAR